MGEKLLRLMKSEGLTSSRGQALPISPISSPDAANRDTICCEKFCSVSRRSTLIGCCSTTKQCTARMKLRSGNNPFRPTFLRQNPQLPNILPVPLTKPISPEIRIPSTRSIRIGSLPEVLEI